MTVVAWDGVTLAADKRCVDGNGLRGTLTKISVTDDGKLLAITGRHSIGMRLLAWWAEGCEPDRFPEVAEEDGATLVVISRANDGKPIVSSYTSGPYPVVFEDQFRAWGSGRDFALAAMYLGCDARRAIEVTCHFQTDCGDGIDSIELP